MFDLVGLVGIGAGPWMRLLLLFDFVLTVQMRRIVV
jgi:hypothetical protein